MKNVLQIGVGGEFAVRLPVMGYIPGTEPLTRVQVVAKTANQWVCEVASYRATNLDQFHPDELAVAILDGEIDYVQEPRQVLVPPSDFVRPWGAIPAHVWAIRPGAVKSAGRPRQRRAVAAQAVAS